MRTIAAIILLLLLTRSACAAPGDEPTESAGDQDGRIKSQM